MRRTAGTLVWALAALAPCAALPEPVYFHKPNVAREAFEADLSDCVELAGGVRRPQPYLPYSPNVYAAAAGAFLAGFMASKEQRHMTKNVLRTCMTDKGYRRVEATDSVSDDLRKLDKAERAARLFTLAASPEPAGQVLPQ